jgi:hypothetical protein
MTESLNTNVDVTSRIQDPKCATEDLSAWAGLSPENDRLIATHKNAGAEILKKLSRSEDEKTRELVTGNPNVSIDVLMNLADDYPRAFLLNPAFDIIVLEDPGVLERLYEPTLAKILAQKECPQKIIDWAYKFYKKKSTYSSRVLMGIVRNPYTSVKTINAILKVDSDIGITCQEGYL